MATAEDQMRAVDAYTRKSNASRASMPPLHKVQQLMRRDRGASGPIWVSRWAIPPPPENDLRHALRETITALGSDGQNIDDSDYAPSLHAEWTGPRAGTSDSTGPEPRMSEDMKYQHLKADATSDAPVVFYLHGGGFVFGSTVVARPMVKRLCMLNGARYLSFNYRLSPEHQMPAQLLDLAVVYFSLLSPPPGVSYSVVPASRLVLAGESAGAALMLGLVQFILHLRRGGRQSIMFNNRSVALDLPCGVAVHSIPADLISALPSAQQPNIDWLGDVPPWISPSWPEEPFWPSNPPRLSTLADWSGVCHPLFSIATVRDWTGAPPIWASFGDRDSMADSAKVMLQTAARQGVVVHVEIYEYMTHSFATVLPSLPQAKLLMKNWAAACSSLARGRALNCGGDYFMLGDLKFPKPLDILNLAPMSQEDSSSRMSAKAASRKHVAYRGFGVPREEKSLL